MLLSITKEQVQKRYDQATQLLKSLISLNTFNEKILFLNGLDPVVASLKSMPRVLNFIRELDAEGEYLTKVVFAIGQGEILFRESSDEKDVALRKFKILLQHLMTVERFYQAIGGLLGYYVAFVSHLVDKNDLLSDVHYSEPPGTDISNQESKDVKALIMTGIETMAESAEIYPIGGSGDRLGLVDERTGEAMPVACLMFNGVTLLEALFRDLIAREYLCYKLNKLQLFTPCVIMTSSEKRNHQHIQKICEEKSFFGRGKERIILVKQPLVPVITEDGNFSQKGESELNLKPGGHGVIWTLCQQAKVFEWLQSLNRRKILVRQINNPIAGIDYGLLAFAGKGMQENADFGFASCHRPVGAAEGVNVYFRQQTNKGILHGVSNVEYTEFKRSGIEDKSSNKGEFSNYPANTNILFADIRAVAKASLKHPVPGQIINLKHKVPFIDESGNRSEINGGRLESIMQNIADFFGSEEHRPAKTYATFNYRSKTISSTKSLYSSGKPIEGTPHGAFYTYWKDTHDLLNKRCKIQVPKLLDIEQYINQGPNFYFRYLPALGPMHTIIQEKLRGGTLANASSCILEISELDVENLNLDGAIHIHASSPLGKVNEKGHVLFGEEWSGKCTLKNVSVNNLGVKSAFWKKAWRGDLHYDECLKIEIDGNGEFFAEDVQFEGSLRIKVSDGVRVTAKMQGERLILEEEPLSKGSTWKWKYVKTDNQDIRVERRNLLEVT